MSIYIKNKLELHMELEVEIVGEENFMDIHKREDND
jgi:hypothetical protein